MSVRLKGLDRAVKKLQKLPQKLRRAERQAVDKAVTFGVKKVIDPVNKQLGIKKKEVRGRLEINRPASTSRGGDIKGSVVPTNAIIPLRLMKYRVARISPTQAAVFARLDLFKRQKRVRRVFVNPKRPGKKEPLLREKGEGRKVITPFGPSMAVHMAALVDKKFLEIISNSLNRDFQNRLSRIL